MSLKRDLELLYEIGAFRFVNRTWVQMLSPEFASTTEHTYRVMWLSLIIAKYEGATNYEKLLKMALVHDLPESRTGDVHYVSRLYTKRNEKLAVKEILNDTSVIEFRKIWEEYEARKSIEAKIVKDADYLDVDLELIEQEFKGNKLRSQFDASRKAVSERLYTKTAKQIWKEIQKSNPHDWHLHARNRFTAGDWSKKNKRQVKKK
ncbi:MAG: HD domain-containing protein [Candidatus Doudnabacteria bacterium]|nr:HD domain-containing protein [Candidatus Doudnabacteria bacterium]